MKKTGAQIELIFVPACLWSEQNSLVAAVIDGFFCRIPDGKENDRFFFGLVVDRKESFPCRWACEVNSGQFALFEQLRQFRFAFLQKDIVVQDRTGYIIFGPQKFFDGIIGELALWVKNRCSRWKCFLPSGNKLSFCFLRADESHFKSAGSDHFAGFFADYGNQRALSLFDDGQNTCYRRLTREENPLGRIDFIFDGFRYR